VRDLNAPQSDKSKVRMLFGVLSIFLLIGLCASIYGGCLLIKSAQSASWPSTDGIVKTAEMGSQSDSHGTTYAAELKYDYQVDGKALTGNKIRTVKVSSSSGSDARKDLNKYPVGAKVKVFYSPTDPADCVLEPGIHPSSWLWLGLGSAFVAFPLILILLALVYGVKVVPDAEKAVDSGTRPP